MNRKEAQIKKASKEKNGKTDKKIITLITLLTLLLGLIVITSTVPIIEIPTPMQAYKVVSGVSTLQDVNTEINSGVSPSTLSSDDYRRQAGDIVNAQTSGVSDSVYNILDDYKTWKY